MASSDASNDPEEAQSAVTVSSPSEPATTRKARGCFDKVRAICLAHLGYMKKYPSIPIVSLLTFAALCATGIILCMSSFTGQDQEMHDEAIHWAEEARETLSRAIESALLPIFSITQFATEIPMFAELPDRIGLANEEDSLSFLTHPRDGSFIPFRNVTGVCDDPVLVQRYAGIASAIIRNSNMQGIIQNIHLAPQGVICLAFGPIDMGPLIGFDAFSHPAFKEVVKSTIELGDEAGIGITGPVVLEDVCPTCGRHLIIRFPVRSDDHVVRFDGKGYVGWGFASAFVNWDALIEQYYILEHFESRGFEFRMTQTERVLDTDTGLFIDRDSVLTLTKGYGARRREATITMPIGESEWVFTVQYVHEPNRALLLTLSVLGPLFFSCLLYTILVQKRLHSSMRGITMTQQAKVDVERNMTAYFAHELRNPLAAMDCALASMPDDLSLETIELVSGMQLCSSFMSNIMNNLLDVRKMEEGKMILHSDPLSLKTLLNNVRKMNVAALRPGVEMHVIVECKEGECVIGDIHRLQQILNNVVTNAIKYTMNGSITLYAGYEGGVVRLECRDTGPGIPKDDQKHLFERFFMRGGAPGSGLGLAIAKQLVDLMGGTIRFDSDPTVKPGTNCVVLLPLPLCEDPSTKSGPPQDEPLIEADLSILVIDDVKMNRAMLKRRFQKKIASNCKVAEASTGEAALSMCEAEVFDVIIVDQYMQDAGGVMVGTDVIASMRRTEIKSLIIGWSGNDLQASFLAAGADLVWGKPIPSNGEILRQLRMWLEEQGNAAHAPSISSQQ